MSRASLLRWLRDVHGWLGLWGAVLGLLFGVTGIVMNHRGPGPLHVSTSEDVREVELPLPTPRPASPEALVAWVRDELHVDGRVRARREPGKRVTWNERIVEQPEQWKCGIVTPREQVAIEHWVGNPTVSVRRTRGSLMVVLDNLHKGVGLGPAWILLVDTLGGSLIVLSLSGVLLWTRLSRTRLAGLAVVGAALAAALVSGLV